MSRSRHARSNLFSFLGVLMLLGLIGLRATRPISEATENISNRRNDDEEPSTEDSLVDSGMIQVALAIAGVGFLLYQFRGELASVSGLGWLISTEGMGKLTMFMGVTAAFLLHSSFWDDWITKYRRRGHRLTGTRVLVMLGHLVVYLVLGGAMAQTAFFIGGVFPVLTAIITTAAFYFAIRPGPL